ncbi:2-oxoglutarate and iron-dependent oxygenase domain-containing protein 2-like [Tubulanus polymorphus]|uniref:2-oxoglutarate and iron-dependent oxygenase domain-containing protein 2-like n=1 Tax=Tubulanus polymorphus TaxID=672921 RepID=UPI003DA26ABA
MEDDGRSNATGDEFICKCFYSNNIFVHYLKRHVQYLNDEEFSNQMSKERSLKDEEIESVLTEIHDEVKRRKSLGFQSVERRKLIKAQYKPLHPHLYNIQESFFRREFVDLVDYCKSESATKSGILSRVEQTSAPRVFSLPVFTREFCKQLIEELSHFEKSDFPKGRPNTMNRYGVLLDEIGFKDFIDILRVEYLQPITTLLYADIGGASVDSHRAFTVKYKHGEDTELNFHFDNAEITLNVSLNDDFDDGCLYFGNMRSEPTYASDCNECKHSLGYGLLHRGQHMHGALPITDGERCNLIIWMRSSEIRNQLCPMCDRIPDLQTTSGFGDGFTKT